MDNKRRQFLKSGLAVGGLGAFAAGYATTTKHMVDDGVKPKITNRKTKNNTF